ncbi:outer membrane receptor for ferric coprogen and ferric-rhodotorulic acid [Nitrosospira lacus]|uniref:Outer membrane receptor for ferric coprogen and ferric-rhodotorulic acid n=1 Tax=Nitrosospira lacus TaxID=1288494 RepID=A0A1W6SM85_9PROT|nr:putative porin [Nitrosospira lacus]ARO86913.1 outer membrane receptor for ferric coprogen and ferric-rhodotorulic acid [Nitrosospira lacus]
MNIRLILTLAAMTAIFAGGAHAKTDEHERVEVLYETTLNLIQLLVAQGVIKQEVADEMIKKAELKAKASRRQAQEKAAQPEAGETKKGEVRVPYIPEHVKKEIRDQLRQEVVGQAKQERWGDVNAIPEWTSRFTMEGDMRLREQADFYADTNAPAANFRANGQNIDNTTEDSYHRERMRMRLGINANVTRGVDLGLRLTTGNVNDPVLTGNVLGPPPISIGSPTSTLQTFGTFNSKFALVLDQAYLRLTPFNWLTVSGGRFPNPFFVGTVGNIYTGTLRSGPHTVPTAGVVHTDLLWDVDLNFEGLAINLHPWLKEEGRTVKPFLNAGIFPLQQINQSETVKAKDKWFFGAQAGLEWAPENTDTKFRVGAAYYDYRNIAGVRNPNFGDTLFNQTATLFRQKGNSLFNIDNDGDPTTNLWALAADYRIANVTMVADYSKFKPIHVIATMDYARNVGYDEHKIFARSGQNIKPQIDAYQFRLTVGYPVITERHQWQVFGFYRRSERDSMLDAFTDSNYLLGGTNHKGYTLHALYGVAHNTWLGLRYNSYDQVSGLPLSIDSVNLDLNARF